MISTTIVGHLGRDAETRDAAGSTVCSFNVASTREYKGEKTTTWIRCSLWGKRGESLAKHLTKGSKVWVEGEMWQREYNDKQYLELRVDKIDPFCGGKRDGASTSSTTRHRDEPAPGGSGDEYGDAGGQDDDIPF